MPRSQSKGKGMETWAELVPEALHSVTDTSLLSQGSS